MYPKMSTHSIGVFWKYEINIEKYLFVYYKQVKSRDKILT